MTQTILIVDDEAQTRALFLNCLAFEGFQTLGASCGSDGLRLAQQHSPDLIVCDIMMPDIDGYQVLSSLRESQSTQNIPFIFLTAKSTMPELRIGMNLGADDYLAKPCTIEQFLGAIVARLRRHAKSSNQQHQNLASRPQRTSHPLPTKLDIEVDYVFPDRPPLNPIFQFIEENFHQPIRLNDIANMAGYSPAYLTSLVRSQTGRTVKQWVVERRMAQARHLISQSNRSINTIAAACGYPDPSYFTRQFRKHHGTSPKAWGNKQRRLTSNTPSLLGYADRA
ncbi:MAG: response regulator [Cyanobacteria bacterium P01_G01_bin.4]